MKHLCALEGSIGSQNFHSKIKRVYTEDYFKHIHMFITFYNKNAWNFEKNLTGQNLHISNCSEETYISLKDFHQI